MRRSPMNHPPGCRLTLLLSVLAALGSNAPPVYSQEAPFAYVANRLGNSVTRYAVDPGTGVLTLQGSTATPSPIAVAVGPSKRFVFVANYTYTSTVSVFSIDPATGTLTGIAGSPFRAGSWTYHVAVGPLDRFLYTANLASNDVSAFSINPVSGALTPVPGSPFPAGRQPYQVAISPSGQFVYTANAESDDVSAFTVDSTSGTLSPIPGSPFHVPGVKRNPVCTSQSGPEAVAVAPSGRHLYVGNACAYTIAVFAIDPVTGGLSPITGSPFATAPAPNGFAFSAAGERLLRGQQWHADRACGRRRIRLPGQHRDRRVDGSPRLALPFWPRHHGCWPQRSIRLLRQLLLE